MGTPPPACSQVYNTKCNLHLRRCSPDLYIPWLWKIPLAPQELDRKISILRVSSFPSKLYPSPNQRLLLANIPYNQPFSRSIEAKYTLLGISPRAQWYHSSSHQDGWGWPSTSLNWQHQYWKLRQRLTVDSNDAELVSSEHAPLSRYRMSAACWCIHSVWCRIRFGLQKHTQCR